MFDPMSVQFEIKRPWPKRVDWGKSKRYWPPIITVWHKDPCQGDNDNTCGWPRNRWRKFHIHHWRIQIHFLQKFRRWALSRCAYCGDRFPWGYAPIRSAFWSLGKRSPWWLGEADVYHHGCESKRRESAKSYYERLASR